MQELANAITLVIIAIIAVTVYTLFGWVSLAVFVAATLMYSLLNKDGLTWIKGQLTNN